MSFILNSLILIVFFKYKHINNKYQDVSERCPSIYTTDRRKTDRHLTTRQSHSSRTRQRSHRYPQNRPPGPPASLWIGNNNLQCMYLKMLQLHSAKIHASYLRDIFASRRHLSMSRSASNLSLYHLHTVSHY